MTSRQALQIKKYKELSSLTPIVQNIITKVKFDVLKNKILPFTGLDFIFKHSSIQNSM